MKQEAVDALLAFFEDYSPRKEVTIYDGRMSADQRPKLILRIRRGRYDKNGDSVDLGYEMALVPSELKEMPDLFEYSLQKAIERLTANQD